MTERQRLEKMDAAIRRFVDLITPTVEQYGYAHVTREILYGLTDSLGDPVTRGLECMTTTLLERKEP